MDKILNSLQNIGYSEKEALAYITLLKAGRGTAYQIAEKSGLKKPTAHVLLGELLKKGAVFLIPGAKKKIYAPRSPDDLFLHADKNLSEAKKYIPQLLSLVDENQSKFKTLYFEGLKGLQNALNYTTDTKITEIVGFYARAEKIEEGTLRVFDAWGSKLGSRGIKLRGLTPDHPSTRTMEPTFTKRNQDVRFLPLEIYSSEVSIESCGDFVRIIDIQRLQSVIIENKFIAKTLKQIFEIAWSTTS